MPLSLETMLTMAPRLAGATAGVPEAPSPASKAGKLAAAASANHKVTEYFPIRRSERKPKAELLKEQMEGMEARLRCTNDSLLDITIGTIEGKGRGIMVSASALDLCFMSTIRRL